MPNIEKHTPGSFCWIELGTTDQNAAKNFYGKLFGWEANDMPMGPNGVYTIFKLAGRDAAAGATLRPEPRARREPDPPRPLDRARDLSHECRASHTHL